LGKLFTPMCLCHQAVYLGTGQEAAILCSWEGNRRPQAWCYVMAAYCRMNDL